MQDLLRHDIPDSQHSDLVIALGEEASRTGERGLRGDCRNRRSVMIPGSSNLLRLLPFKRITPVTFLVWSGITDETMGEGLEISLSWRAD